MGFTQAGRGSISLNAASAPPEPLGFRVTLEDTTYGTRDFRLMLAAATVAVTSGVCIPPASQTATWKFTNVITNVDTVIAPVGLAIGAITTAQYGYLQTGGLHTACPVASVDTTAFSGRSICVAKNTTGLGIAGTPANSAAAVGEAAAKIGYCTAAPAATGIVLSVVITGCGN